MFAGNPSQISQDIRLGQAPRSGPRNFVTDCQLQIASIIPGGQAIGTLPDGKKAMLWNALPGETVTEFIITKNKSHYIEGIATRIANSSPHRITPADDCYLATSPWQIMDYTYELEQKRAILAEIFRQHDLATCGQVSTTYRQTAQTYQQDDQTYSQPTTTIPQVSTDGQDLFYRNKMEYSLYYDHADAQIHLAFHGRGSHRKIPIANSSIERREIFAHALKIVDDLNAQKADARQYQSLLLRCNQNGRVSGGLFENHRPHPQFENLTDKILGHNYSYSPNGFFQINLPVYEMALQAIQQHIHTAKVLDLYAGVGTIGLSVARDKDLTLVECDQSAYRELVRNCATSSLSSFSGTSATNGERSNESSPVTTGRAEVFPEKSSGCSRTQAILAKSEEALDFIESAQTVIVDPPRAGCDTKLLTRFLEILPQTIIYLSCNPATQARDVKILSEKYHITTVQPYNFFPRTPHLENLIVLERKS